MQELEFGTVNVVVIRDDVVESLSAFPDNDLGNAEAELTFLNKCAENLSNWDDYTPDDRSALLEQGYEKFGHGSICLAHSGE
jgi:hypothetical protein